VRIDLQIAYSAVSYAAVDNLLAEDDAVLDSLSLRWEGCRGMELSLSNFVSLVAGDAEFMAPPPSRRW
jgi:hypothetical protein